MVNRVIKIAFLALPFEGWCQQDSMVRGGIAAYKCPELIRQLIAEQAEVKVIATESALEFVTTVTLQTVSRNKVYSEVFE